MEGVSDRRYFDKNVGVTRPGTNKVMAPLYPEHRNASGQHPPFNGKATDKGGNIKTRTITIFLFPLLLSSHLEVQADDVSKGRDYFLKQCVACHAFSCNRDSWAYAPRLGGLLGRKAGGVEDFTGYSDGFKNSEIIWTDETLDAFLKDLSSIDPKSLMVANRKIDNGEQRKEVIAFLKTEDPAIDIFCPK